MLYFPYMDQITCKINFYTIIQDFKRVLDFNGKEKED